jgi:CRISPR system Cascade subunit CasB
MTDSTRANTSTADPSGDEDIAPRTAVGAIAGLLAGDGFLSSGERATLRRVDPACPVTPALWRVLGQTYQLAPDGLPEAQKRRWERRWGLLILGMAHVPGLHRYEVPLGEALAHAGWSEVRFVRLMEAGADTLPVLVRRMAQYLASKEQPANWDDVRQLLFSVDRGHGEDVRLRIARTYYRTLYAQEQDD